jgi:hypothetical protein
MSKQTAYRQFAALFVIGSVLSGSATAALVENEVLLLYNSHNAESAAIHSAFFDAHPGIQRYDLNLDYKTVPEYPRQVTPPDDGINNQYITPETFTALFGPDSEFRGFVTDRPEILAIVTTRGLPAAVSDNFDPDPRTGSPPISGIWCGFEAALSHPGLPGFNNSPFLQTPNPYVTSSQPFANYLEKSCETGGPCRGDYYLVSRLDASVPGEDYDGDGDIDEIDGVVAIIQRAEPKGINRYATSFVFDIFSDNPYGLMSNYRSALAALWMGNWCVLYDDSEVFIHGPGDPEFDPETDGLFSSYPIVGLATTGTNHGGPEPIGRHYAGNYETSTYAVFNSLESGNGWTLHAPGEYAWNQGQVLDWLALSGGTFAIGNIQEPASSNVCLNHPLFSNFFVAGLSWGEAVYTALPVLGQYQTPIGDPLARVIAYDADINDDRLVDLNDLSLVLAQMGTSGPEGDINEDGWVDESDLQLVQDAYGRDCSSSPLTPLPGTGIGDLNGDCVIDQEDLAILLAHYGPCPPPPPEDPDQRCIGDLNGDLVVDDADLDILLAHYDTVVGDVDGNGIVDQTDMDRVLAAYNTCDGDPGYDADADIDNSGCVDMTDLSYVLACFGYNGLSVEKTEPTPLGG